MSDSGNQKSSLPQRSGVAISDISIVIPTYSSQEFVAEVVVELFRVHPQLAYEAEVIIVDDGSPDSTWEVLLELRRRYPKLNIIRLPENVGQHRAVCIGLGAASGAVAVVMDDDGQNPPTEIHLLLGAIKQGHDLVFGFPIKKQHGLIRRIGSRLTNSLVMLLYCPTMPVKISNFKAVTRQIYNRMLENPQASSRYTNGEMLSLSESPASIPVKHRRQVRGPSRYNFVGLLGVLISICLATPLRTLGLVLRVNLVASISMIVSALFVFSLSAYFNIPHFSLLAFAVLMIPTMILGLLALMLFRKSL